MSNGKTPQMEDLITSAHNTNIKSKDYKESEPVTSESKWSQTKQPVGLAKLHSLLIKINTLTPNNLRYTYEINITYKSPYPCTNSVSDMMSGEK